MTIIVQKGIRLIWARRKDRNLSTRPWLDVSELLAILSFLSSGLTVEQFDLSAGYLLNS
jgi:hypothetical protein